MQIEVASAVGTGPTELAAFHDALAKVGIQDTNLIVLSSVIPAGSTVVKVSRASRAFTRGNRLYVVMSKESTIKPLTHVYAGVGWYQREDKSGYFVEHHGDSEESVREKINRSLDFMMKLNNETAEKHMDIKGTMCKEHPVCAIVVAIYDDADW